MTNHQEYNDNNDNNDVEEQANNRALHIEEGNDDETEEEYRHAMRRRLRHDPAVTRRKVLRRYYLLSTLAVTFTVTCPQTFLWNSGTLVRPFFVARLLIVYLGTLSFLTFCLQGSNPGYLTPGAMQQLDDWEAQQQEQQQEERKSSQRTNSSDDAEKKRDQGSTDFFSPRVSLPTEAENTTAANDRLALLENSNDNDSSLLRPTRRPPCRHCPHTMPPPPLRSHHCHKCGHHVATFDHHCDFVGTCIGECNHARFWVFLSLQLYGFVMCVAAVLSSPVGILDWILATHRMATTPWTTLVYIVAGRVYLYPLVAAATLMWIFHTFLACTNSTTFEFAKGARHLEYLHPATRMCDLPFSDRLDRNLSRWIRRGLSETDASWRPTLWQRPGEINHESEEWWQNPWQNKYWSCC